MGHNELDALILRTLLVDGECFIRVHRRPSSLYKISFEVLDTCDIDYTKIKEFAYKQNAIVLGVEVDTFFKPVAYHIRKQRLTTYLGSNPIKLPASDIIHIFRKERAHQTRGIPPFNAVMNDLKQLDEYQEAELMAAKLGAAMTLFYERNDQAVAGDIMKPAYNVKEEEPNMNVHPGMIVKVADGYNAKTLTTQHPNTGYDDFVKSVMKKISAALGISYNSCVKDLESVNYSSLREATIDEQGFFAELQNFLIESWKEVEFRMFVDNIGIPEDEKIELLRHHTWICPRRGYFDVSKDILASEREIKLGLKSPVQIMEENGNDPEEVLKSWKLWNELCVKYGLNFNDDKDDDNSKLNTEDQDFNDEQVQNDALNAKRD